MIDKAVSKKFGDVKKISLFERSEFEIFSRRAFCVLMGRAPARTMGIRGRFKEGERGLARPLYPLLIRNVKASAFNKLFKDKVFKSTILILKTLRLLQQF